MTFADTWNGNREDRRADGVTATAPTSSTASRLASATSHACLVPGRPRKERADERASENQEGWGQKAWRMDS